MKLPAILWRWVWLLPLLLQIACVGTTPPSQFYLLEPLTETGSASNSAAKLMLALLPVKIPHYLDRAQIVSAVGQNTYQLDELHRWAESLEDNMSRVMLQDLTALIPADVVLSNTQRGRQATLKLAVSILEFHLDLQGQARLIAQWQVNRGDEVVLSRQSAYRIPAVSDQVQLKVQALNQCLNQLNKDIATAIVGLKTQ